MTKKQLLTSTRGAYVTPECEALSMQTKGLICGSLDAVMGIDIEDAVVDDWTDGGTVLL